MLSNYTKLFNYTQCEAYSIYFTLHLFLGSHFISYEIKSNSSGDFILFLMILNMNFPQHVIYENSEYDQEIPQSQCAGKNMALQGRATQPSRDTRKTN